MVGQLTEEQALTLLKSKFWEPMSLRARAEFQLYQERLCMPFEVFHEALEAAIGRPIMVHEFRDAQALQQELRGEKPAPTLGQILDMAVVPGPR